MNAAELGLLERVLESTRRYLGSLPERRVFPSDEALAGLDELDEPLPDGACEPAETIELLERVGAPATVAHTGGRYFGFVTVLASCDDDELMQATVRLVQASGECWCGPSTWRGRAAIRVSVSSWATTPEDVARSVAAFVRARRQAHRG